jgi:outer membrane lipoprotein-sorting protein
METAYMGRSLRVAVTFLIGATVIATAAPRALAQTVDEIVARNIQGRGGVERIKAVQSMKQTSHLKIQGMSATLTLYAKRPNLSRQEVSIAGATAIAAFDGQNAWGVNPMLGQTTPQVVSGPDADKVRSQASFDPPLLDYGAKGTKVEYLGTEPDGARTLMHLRITDKAGIVTNCYLDSQTALETKIVAAGPTGPVETRLSDYREVGGLKMPFAIRTTAAGVVVADVAVDTIEFDLPMPASLFTMPGKM